MKVALAAVGLLAVGAAVVAACGFTTHNFIANRARGWFNDAAHLNGSACVCGLVGLLLLVCMMLTRPVVRCGPQAR
jgi:hypothetical protein